MPIFEYICSGCGKHFETLVLGSNTGVECPHCGSEKAQKKMSSFAFKSGSQFVGTGKKASAACTGCTSTSCSSCGS